MIDLTGQKFERLVVIRHAGKDNSNHAIWLCMCNCGNEKTIRGSSLKYGQTRSCGCLAKETVRKLTIINKNNQYSVKHGHTKNGRRSHIYIIWVGMIQRCSNLLDPKYTLYGERGIVVCAKWKKFENFLADMGEPPTNKHQIDRINNNGNYCKSNCRWVTREKQGRNKRNNHLETYNGKTQCLSQWSEETGINRNTIASRLKFGWSIEEALTKPVGKFQS